MKTESLAGLRFRVSLAGLALTVGCASAGPVGSTADGSGGSPFISGSGAPGGAGRPAFGGGFAGTLGGTAASGLTGTAGKVSAGAAGTGGMRGAAGIGNNNNNGTGGARGMQAGAGTGGATGAGGMRGSAGSTNTGGAGTTSPGAIWMPKPGVTWQWQLSGTLDTSVDVQMYDIDLFSTPTSTIQQLHAAGRIVVCYFSAGSYEPDRPDSAQLEQTGLGSVLDGWPDEKWLDIRMSGVRDIMKARLDMAQSKNCDGVEPDNVDGYDNSNGLGLTRQDQLDYNQFLATEGHARKLSVGLKNALDLVPDLLSSFDWALNEECLKYNECDSLAPFISANKAVFHCEYSMSKSGICDKDPQGFSTIIKDLDLDAYRLACP